MPVETAADRAAFFSTDEFGATATYTRPGHTGVDIAGIFDAPWLRIEGVAEVPITSATPAFICRAVDLPAGAAQGDSFGLVTCPDAPDWEGVALKVRELRPDGSGLVTLDLERT
jgi:hypothetical protein